ncbi:MAG: PilX N-terminal domain-containing pilus assembly protein, partial [Candidatus Methylomirabilales bacterium]
MKQRITRATTAQRGAVLIATLLVMTVLLVQGLTFLAVAQTEDTVASNYRNHTQTFYAAEAGLEAGVVGLRALLAATPTPTPTALGGLLPPTLTDPNYSFTTFQVAYIRPTPYATTIDTGPYAGLLAQTTDFRITAAVTGPRQSRTQLQQVVKYLEIPLFQFGVFYGTGVDLEIAPGPPMTFNGRVHANSNIYVRNASMQFDSFVTTVGNVYRYLKRDPATRGSDPQIRDGSGTYQVLNFDHDTDPGFTNPWAVQDWRTAALGTFDGLVRDSAMGVQEIIPPLPDLFYDPANPDVVAHQLIERGTAADSPELQAAKLYYQADLRIEDTTGTAKHKDGTPVTLPAGVVTPKTFYDKREEANITVLELDISALMASGEAPQNGILYVAHDGLHKGVRLVNGTQLPGQGFTVVSENPVYIQGDYNTVNKVPAAVLADAITVLSTNWGPNNSDSKGAQVTSNRPASNTTVNAAFALGPNAESAVGQGNGQLENVIRFLENWNGKTFTYNGSIIALWHSLQATGNWRCCGNAGDNYYRPPNRNWAYDPLFNTNLAPGT